MTFKYLRTLAPKHWLKVLLPVYLLLTVIFLKGFITDQVNRFFSSAILNTEDVFNVRLSGEDASFVKALAKVKNFELEKPADYSVYLSDRFIQLQKNERQVAVAAVKNTADTKESDEKVELPPTPKYLVSSIFVGKIRQFAVINDKVVKIGDKLSYGEEIINIKDGKILVKGKWGDRWLFVNY